MRVSNNIHNVSQLESAELQEEWEEEHKIPVKKHNDPTPKPAEEKKDGEKKEGEEEKKDEAPKEEVKENKQEYEVQMKKKKGTTTLKHVGESYALNKQQKDEKVAQEAQWFKEDNLILELKALKNNLESYAYTMRGDLDQYGGSLRAYIDPAVVDNYLSEINVIVEWLYGEGQNASKDIYVQKYESLRKVGDPCKARKRFFEEAQEVLNRFESLA